MVIKCSGAHHFRLRLICATLSGQPVRIGKIRAQDSVPGVIAAEVSLLRLLERLQNGCVIQINETGTSVYYKPGILEGGRLDHECPVAASSELGGLGSGSAFGSDSPTPVRGIGYFLEVLVALAPFCKRPVECTLSGITNAPGDLGLDVFRGATLRLMKQFGIGDEEDSVLECKILKRGAFPLGGGQVLFKCPVVRQLKPINLVQQGRVNRIRGVAYSTRVSPQIGMRMVDSARGILNDFIPDVWIYTDHSKGQETGKCPGFGITLLAESTGGDVSNSVLCAEVVATQQSQPEDLGKLVVYRLLEEIKSGGVIDTQHQWLALLYMVVCSEDVSRIRLGQLSEYTIQALRYYKEFFQTSFQIKSNSDLASAGADSTVILSCRGSGYYNMAKSVT